MRTVLRVLAVVLAVPLAVAFLLVAAAIVFVRAPDSPLVLGSVIAVGALGAATAGWLVWRWSLLSEVGWSLTLLAVWIVLLAAAISLLYVETRPMYDTDAKPVPIETVQEELKYREAGGLPPHADDIRVFVQSPDGEMCLRFRAPLAEARQFIGETLDQCWTEGEYPLHEPYCPREWWTPPEDVPWRGDLWRVVKLDEQTGTVYFAGVMPD